MDFNNLKHVGYIPFGSGPFEASRFPSLVSMSTAGIYIVDMETVDSSVFVGGGTDDSLKIVLKKSINKLLAWVGSSVS